MQRFIYERSAPIMFPFRVVTFPRAGLKINLRRSGLVRAGTHRLVLAKVDRRAAGSYGCQGGRTMRDKTSVPKAEIMTDRSTGQPTSRPTNKGVHKKVYTPKKLLL